MRADVDRGLVIVEQIATLKKELDGIGERIEAAALNGEQIDLMDEEREGKQFLATGSKVIVPVILAADLLVKSFAKDSAVHKAIEAHAGGKLGAFYKETNKFEALTESGKKFRQRAVEILGAKFGPGFITACVQRDKLGIAKSAIKIEWGRAVELAPV